MSDQKTGGLTGAQFGREIVEATKGYIERVTAPLIQRIEELEKRVAGGVSGGTIDRDGHLILTLSDGSQKDFGRVAGKDVDPEDVVRKVREQVEQIPKPRDGFGFDTMTFEQSPDDERVAVLRFVRGDQVKEFPLNIPGFIDRGVWREGMDMKRGDGVTFAGHFWIAQKQTSEKPGTGSDFRMAVKKGRDGKDGTVTIKDPPQPIRVVPPARQ